MPNGSDPVPRPTLTFVSRCGSAAAGTFGRISGLVRSSHGFAGVVLALLTSGCLIPDPPTWDAGKPTRPQLIDPNPSPTKFIALGGTSPKQNETFQVYEVSEDEGHTLRALWYLNYGLPSLQQYINFKDIPPGHLDDPKPISVTYGPIGVSGCIPFTILVTHVENDSNEPDHHPTDPNDTDSVTWWLDINDNSGSPNEVNACPMQN